MKVGTLVKVLNPDYAKGLFGIVEGYETEFDRWIIKLESGFKHRDEIIRLSLKESEFETDAVSS